MTLLTADITVFNGAKTTVERISVSLKAGQAVTLIGETGSGKSLFADAIMGTLPKGLHAAGALTIDGIPVDPAAPSALEALWGHKISVLPQEPWRALDPLMRSEAQVAEVHKLVANSPMASQDAADDLKTLGLADAGDRYPFELSGGMAQRLAIAAARAGGANIVVADEPTKGLDVDRRLDVAKRLSAVTASGGALLTITHDLQLAEALGGEILVLRKGRLIERGEAAQVLGSPRDAYTADLIKAEPRYWPVTSARECGGPVLQGRGITVERGGRALCKDLDLQLHAGEVVGLCGPSGVGKSSLGDTLLGITKPAKGDVIRDGAEPKRFQKLWQDPPAAFAPHITLGRGLHDLMSLHNIPPSKLPPLLETLRLEHGLLDRKPDAVSGGELQRLSIARALLLDPIFLFADEPTSRLDPITQREVMQMLVSLAREKGIAVLLVSHDQDLIARTTDRQVTLEVA